MLRCVHNSLIILLFNLYSCAVQHRVEVNDTHTDNTQSMQQLLYYYMQKHKQSIDANKISLYI